MPSVRALQENIPNAFSVTGTLTAQLAGSAAAPIVATVGGQQYRSIQNLSLNLATTGAGGLDTGSVAANTYFLHLVVSSGALALVASLNSAPSGFTAYKQVGRVIVGYRAGLVSIIDILFEAVYQANLNQKAYNILINGDMAIAQRTTSVLMSSTVRFCVDRWNTHRNSDVTGLTGSRQSSGLAALPYCYRLQRSASDVSTQQINMQQNVITENAVKYQGKIVTLSFYARAGANFSASGNTLLVNFFSGTGTNESIRSGYTGQVQVMAASVTLTTSWQRFSFALVIPSNSTEFAPNFGYNPTGTAGANDFFEITGIMLNEGGLQEYRGMGPGLADDYRACQQYYEFIQGICGVAETTSMIWVTAGFAVQKWTIPVISSVGSVSVRQNQGAADFTSSSPVFQNQSATVKGFWTQITGFSGLVASSPVADRVFNSNIRAEAEIY